MTQYQDDYYCDYDVNHDNHVNHDNYDNHDNNQCKIQTNSWSELLPDNGHCLDLTHITRMIIVV